MHTVKFDYYTLVLLLQSQNLSQKPSPSRCNVIAGLWAGDSFETLWLFVRADKSLELDGPTMCTRLVRTPYCDKDALSRCHMSPRLRLYPCGNARHPNASLAFSRAITHIGASVRHEVSTTHVLGLSPDSKVCVRNWTVSAG